MARHNVIVTPMYKYTRKSPKGEFLGWGNVATRKATTEATSPRLLAYRSCIAGAMSGASGSLKAVQERFQSVAHTCASKVSGVRTKMGTSYRV